MFSEYYISVTVRLFSKKTDLNFWDWFRREDPHVIDFHSTDADIWGHFHDGKTCSYSIIDTVLQNEIKDTPNTSVHLVGWLFWV